MCVLCQRMTWYLAVPVTRQNWKSYGASSWLFLRKTDLFPLKSLLWLPVKIFLEGGWAGEVWQLNDMLTITHVLRQPLELLCKVYLKQLSVVDVRGSKTCLNSTKADNKETIFASLMLLFAVGVQWRESFILPSSGRSGVIASYTVDICSLGKVQIQCLAQGRLSWVNDC